MILLRAYQILNPRETLYPICFISKMLSKKKTTKVGFPRRFQKEKSQHSTSPSIPRHTGRKDTAVTQIRSRIGLSRLEAIPRDGTGATEHHDELKKIHRLMKPQSLPVYPPQNGEDKMFPQEGPKKKG